MRPPALFCLPIMFAGLLSGCTGTGVFLDHTTQWFQRDPNMPAGSSEMFLRIRGEKVDVPPLTPEPGNVWPADSGPDPTLQEIQARQNDEIRRNGGQPVTGGPGGAAGAGGGFRGGPAGGPGSTGNAAVDRANQADRGLPPPAAQPAPPGRSPTRQTPSGPTVDVTGQGTGRGYRNLQSAAPSGSPILVPNGNGTSTLIGPDGSVSTVPTRP